MLTTRLGLSNNAQQLAAPNLEVISGKAPDALRGLDTPDAIFIGGGLTNAGVLERCWQKLRLGGRLVANAVSLEAEMVLYAFAAKHDVKLTRLQTSHLDALGRYQVWRNAAAVTQMLAVKSE